MEYQSTRSEAVRASGAEAVLQGMAPDGGLFVPAGGVLPRVDAARLCGLASLDLAAEVVCALLPDFSRDETAAMVRRAYAGRFETADLTPTVRVGERWVLELFRGPTAAFKDVALSLLPQLMAAARAKCGAPEEIAILTATSGDTGKAALEGFRDVPGTRILVFYPAEGVSPVQRLQMVTQPGENVTVCALRGNFDDAQRGVKAAFRACTAQDLLRGRPVRLSSANSINIGRLVPQIVYYFKAYGDLLRAGALRMGEPLDFVVPTGNFGDILAGWCAGAMGLPVGTLVCASNENDVLTEFFRTGRYDRRRPFHKTSSPSMDILVSSNLERLLYLESRDTVLTARLLRELEETGCYRLPEDLAARIGAKFRAAYCGEAETRAAIRQVWADHGYLMDPHTAVAWHAAERCAAGRPTVVLATASPFKFPGTVLEALGEAVPADAFAAMDRLTEVTGVAAPRCLRDLAGTPVRHRDEIDRGDLLPYVLQKLEG